MVYTDTILDYKKRNLIFFSSPTNLAVVCGGEGEGSPPPQPGQALPPHFLPALPQPTGKHCLTGRAMTRPCQARIASQTRPGRQPTITQ